MLTELRIENFAIIDHLELSFQDGLVIFTGETGAGKSIIMDALELVMGGRGESTFIRTGAERATIEAEFKLGARNLDEIHTILKREDLLDEEHSDYILLTRELRDNGRSTGRVNGRTTNISTLRELGEYLVDIHGQSEHLSLLSIRKHLDLLDRFGNLWEERSAYRKVYRRFQSITEELEELRRSEADAARQADLLSYQINEIEAANLSPGEEEELKQERSRLANAESIASATQEAMALLDDGTIENPAVIDLLGKVIESLESISKVDKAKSELTTRAQTVFDEVSEISRELRDYIEEIEFNPKRLGQVEDRLNLVFTLQRKYGENITAVQAFAEKARQQLENLTHAEERIEELEAEQVNVLEEIGKLGVELSRKRHEAADQLASAVENELQDLRMSGARFKVSFQHRPDQDGIPISDGQRVAFDETGLEKIEFVIETNPGEGFKPLVKIASGGETSRLMLALKNVLAQADQIPTLVFDEIDQGIGGRVGGIVGFKLWNLTAKHQVFCITHLPQLAAFGNQHIRVEKKVQDGRTTTGVTHLSGDVRVQELAQMLGNVSEGTLKSAREILGAANQLMIPNPIRE